jgi:hypothetical protein
MAPRKNQPDRKAWLIAWALTVALHAAGALGFRNLAPIQPTQAAVQRPEPVQLVFSQSGPRSRKDDSPHFFSELPPDRADAPPAKADFLSNVTSRARDRVPGGDAGLPRMQGEGDAPTVALEPGGSPTPPAVASSPAPKPADRAVSPATPSPQPGATHERNPSEAGAQAAPQQKPSEDRPQEAKNAASNNAGAHFDIHQMEMDHPEGNAGLTGDISLNTTAWNYAPWLMRFRMQLLQRWIAPPAYYYGIIKDGGWAVIEIEISRSGKLMRLQLLEQQGHPSLITAAEAAVRSMSPIEPLPDDFPEPTLVLRLRMIYPKIRPR